MSKFTRVAAGLALVTSAAVSSNAMAEVSYNIGYASEYHFRGIFQKTSSASAGVDFEQSGFYAGAWTADVGDGLEVDGYFGYGIETDAGFSASLGFTGYYYTGEFDDTYEEINVNLGYSIVSLEYSFGTYDGFGTKSDYDFLALTIAPENGLYATYGTFGDEADGSYLEVGYGTSVADFDVGVSFIFADKDLSDQLDSGGNPTGGESIVFTLGKSF